jgi:hypothetical protein
MPFLEDPTTAVVAHGLMSSMAAVVGTAQTLRDHVDDVFADRRVTLELLDRLVRQAELSASVLRDMVRGLPPEVSAALDRTIRLPV